MSVQDHLRTKPLKMNTFSSKHFAHGKVAVAHTCGLRGWGRKSRVRFQARRRLVTFHDNETELTGRQEHRENSKRWFPELRGAVRPGWTHRQGRSKYIFFYQRCLVGPDCCLHFLGFVLFVVFTQFIYVTINIKYEPFAYICTRNQLLKQYSESSRSIIPENRILISLKCHNTMSFYF